MAEQGKSDKRILYVGGLEENVNREALEQLFIPFGEVQEVNVPFEEASKKHRGFAFVSFELAEDAFEAMDNLNEAEFYGKVLKINFAKPEAMASAKAVWDFDQYHKPDEIVKEDENEKAIGKEVENQLNKMEQEMNVENMVKDT